MGYDRERKRVLFEFTFVYNRFCAVILCGHCNERRGGSAAYTKEAQQDVEWRRDGE